MGKKGGEWGTFYFPRGTNVQARKHTAPNAAAAPRPVAPRLSRIVVRDCANRRPPSRLLLGRRSSTRQPSALRLTLEESSPKSDSPLHDSTELAEVPFFPTPSARCAPLIKNPTAPKANSKTISTQFPRHFPLL